MHPYMYRLHCPTHSPSAPLQGLLFVWFACRLTSTAAFHHKRQQLRLCFARWRRWCREEALRRAITHEAESRKEKMATLLQAVRRKGEKQPHPQQSAPPIPPSIPKQKHTAPDVTLITSKIVRQELVSCCSQCVQMSHTRKVW